MPRPVVVGVDGSPSSLVAADHAAHEAVLRGCALHLVHGYLHLLGYGVPVNPYAVELPEPNPEAQRMLTETAVGLRARWPGLTVEVRQVAGGPGATLVVESRRAELVVVGSRGLGGFTGLLLGSVSTQVSRHAQCPVLVVRGTGPTAEPGGEAVVDAPLTGPDVSPAERGGPVVVGVDGSDPSRLAARYAAGEAVRRERPLVLIHVWSAGRPKPTGGAGGESWPPDRFAEFQAAFRAGATELLSAAATEVRDQHPELPVEVRPVPAADVASALVEASREAALLVVGPRGRGGFTGLVLGSVSQALVQHAHCPVLVTHQPKE